METLNKIIEDIICCPNCKAGIEYNKGVLSCLLCKSVFRFHDGILIMMPRGVEKSQDKEREVREKVANEHGAEDIEKIYKVIKKHHCMPVMIAKADEYRKRFTNDQWVVDVGCGSGYYWKNSKPGAKLILIDFAMSNLKAARIILKDTEDILFVQADASCMPLKENSISGIWSVQVTQHFPDIVMKKFLDELKRILKKNYFIEVYNLNPDMMHRFVYGLFGKKFHIKGQYGDMLQNKLNSKELLVLWDKFLGESEYKIMFSELFFHPNFKIFPQSKIIPILERILDIFPLFTKLFARQISINIKS